MQFRRLLTISAIFAAGLLAGGTLFSGTTPRSFLAFHDCERRCLKANELAGLVASVLALRAPALIPGVVLESDRCVAIRHPKAEARVHYVLFPKHDVRNIASLTPEDTPYVLDCFAMLRTLVERDGLRNYQVLTNGPGMQDIAYLHFHLIAR